MALYAKEYQESLETLCSNRMMTFQIDTKVFGKELDKLSLNKNSILKILSKEGDLNSNSNDKLTDILNAFLALFRPGPMKSSSHIKYIERLLGKPWKHEVIDNWLLPFIQDTFGLIVYQEQVMKIYSNAAIVLDKNYNPILDKDGKFITASEEETDEVRRAMGKKDMASLNKLDAKGKFMRGLKIQGVSEDKASKIWDEIEPFAEYGFNCIDKSSLILTDHGYIEVCKINLSEHKIASLDENSGILFENPTFVGKTGEKEVFEVLLEDNTVIRATLDHPFLFMGNWVKLERLIEFGFFEVINQFNNSKVIKVKSVKYLGVKDVYDITMPTNHNFIMHGGVVAHNCPHSYHYGIITAVTLFLKAHYQKYFFRVTMGLADASDASRFLSEIQRFVKAPDILYSDEVFWEINDGYYYPGLSAVEGLKTKDIEKILETRNKINNSNLELNALEFFRNFGKITPSLATLLAKSGSLRSLGSQETIANSYIEALKTINGFSNDDIINISNEQESNEKVKIENADDYDSINIKSVGKKSKPKTKNKAFKLGKKEEEIYEIFLKLGPKYADNSSNEDNIGKVLTIESAMDIVTSNRTKGAGIRHLSAAVEYEEKLNKVSNKPPLVMVKSLLNMAINDEILLEPNQKYRIIAIPRSISTSKSYDGKPTEPKVNFTSEGSDISLKFSKKYQTEKLEADLLMLKDGKMSVPFIIEVYAGRFTNDRKEVINYYKIESIEKIITN